MNFSDDLTGLDRSIEEHLCDDAALIAQGRGGAIPVRVMITHPVELDRLQSMSIGRSRPEISIARAAAPDLREGDVIRVSDDESWQIASAPTRSGDGRWWQAELEPWE